MSLGFVICCICARACVYYALLHLKALLCRGHSEKTCFDLAEVLILECLMGSQMRTAWPGSKVTCHVNYLMIIFLMCDHVRVCLFFLVHMLLV